MKDKPIKLYDSKTDQHLEFAILQDACNYIFNETGKRVSPGALHLTIMRGGTLVKKRFACPQDNTTYLYSKNGNNMKVNGWLFTHYPYSKNVVVADRTLRWYDKDRIEEITEELKSYGCKVYWDTEKAKRNTVGCEIYKRFPEEKTLLEKTQALMEIIKKIKFLQ